MDVCKVQGKTSTEVARQAIGEHLDRQDSGVQAQVRDQLSKEIEQLKDIIKAILVQQQRTENRMAALMARNNIDIGVVYQVLWFRSDPETRQRMFDEARNNAVERSRASLKGGDDEIKGLMKNAIGS